LAAIFNDKAMIEGDGLELSKNDFVTILKESGILILPAKKKEEAKGAAGGDDSK